ncbi:MAG: hypothetical protein ACOX7P_05260 [Oscillospiraceae bacterium]|jgi:hypothetical protein
MRKKPEFTREWLDKLAGERYNNSLDYYGRTDLNWNMYKGNQWVGIHAGELPKFVMNIYAAATEFIIASIMSKPIRAEFAADNIPKPADDDTSPQAESFRLIRKQIELLNRAARLKWEKEKMDFKLRMNCLLDAACSGDMCAHVYWDADASTGQNETGDFHTEIVDGGNVFFGNPNIADVESQPYIVVSGRELVSKLRAEARANGVGREDYERILPDADTEYQIGEGKNELEGGNEDSGKTTYVIKYRRDPDTGRIFWSKSTRDCLIRKDVDLGISRYPIAWGNWRRNKNSYHGIPIGNGLIDNQISINQLFAMVVYWAKLNAFGKVIIDETRIQQWSNKIGEVIKAQGNVGDAVQQLAGGSFNTAMLTIIDMAIKYTKEFVGANDAALGQVNPELASGAAIMMTAKQASIPHANIESNLHQFIEDLYLIWGEFYLKKYSSRTLYFRGEEGIECGDYDASLLSDVLLSCEVNVGQSTLWSESLRQQNLDNLLKGGYITPVQYFERIKDESLLPDAQGLATDARLKEMLQAQGDKLIKQARSYLGEGPVQPDKALTNKPPAEAAPKIVPPLV